MAGGGGGGSTSSLRRMRTLNGQILDLTLKKKSEICLLLNVKKKIHFLNVNANYLKILCVGRGGV